MSSIKHCIVGVLGITTPFLAEPSWAQPARNIYDLEQQVDACQTDGLFPWLYRGFDPNLAGDGELLNRAMTCESTADPKPRDNPDRCQRKDAYRFDLVNLLLEFGANPLVPADSDRNPLLVAVKTNCNWGAVQSLLEAGANPNIVAGDGRTVLIVALDQRDGGINARWLIHWGADVEAPDRKGLTPLQHFLVDPRTCSLATDTDSLKQNNKEKMEALIFGKANIARKTLPDFVSPTNPAFFGAHDAAELLAARMAEPNLSAERQACFDSIKSELDYRIKFPPK